MIKSNMPLSGQMYSLCKPLLCYVMNMFRKLLGNDLWTSNVSANLALSEG